MPRNRSGARAARRSFTTHSNALGEPNEHELTQALALLNDMTPLEERAFAAKKLLAPSDWIETTLSQSLQKYEALIRCGYGQEAVAAVDREWGRMLDAGATSFWETREGWKAFSEAGSLCHGWSAIPVYVYSLVGNASRGVADGRP